jgi:hypothetical protein
MGDQDGLLSDYGDRPARYETKGAALDTIKDIVNEVRRAREKFPGNRLLLAALTEEVGELAKAMLQDRPKDEIRREAIQVCAVAVRILEEGDASFANLTEAETKA